MKTTLERGFSHKCGDNPYQAPSPCLQLSLPRTPNCWLGNSRPWAALGHPHPWFVHQCPQQLLPRFKGGCPAHFSPSTAVDTANPWEPLKGVNALCTFDEELDNILASVLLIYYPVTVQGVCLYPLRSWLISHHENENTVSHSGVNGDGKQTGRKEVQSTDLFSLPQTSKWTQFLFFG